MPENDTPAYGGTGALAGALAKAQAAFPAIPRDREVTVTLRDNKGSYKFKYAPLDSILNATRKPLSDNGLAIVQLLDDDTLVTSLLHESGAILSGRTPLPATEGIQAFGSAITYLRRYAIQALLGIAAEEDDDGNRAAGNGATFGGKAPDPSRDGLIGNAEKTDKMTGDFELRQSPDKGAFLGFRLRDGSPSGFLCEAWGDLAEAMKAFQSHIVGHRVQVWGKFEPRPLIKGGSYRAFVVEKIQTPTITLPASGGSGQSETGADESVGIAPDESAPSVPAFSEAELADLEPSAA